MRDMWNDIHFPIKPIDALKQGYIYTQPVHAESRFDNALENFFSGSVEAAWTPLVERIKARQQLDQQSWQRFIEFMLSMRVRVPNTIKAVIWALRESVLLAGSKIPAEGLLAGRFKELNPDFLGEPQISDLVETGLIKISIDPHRALLSFDRLIRSNKAILSIYGNPKFVHNNTRIDFISSDNPFISHIHENEIIDIKPYSYMSSKNIEIIFPITSRIAFILNTRKSDKQHHFTITNEETVKKINTKISLYSDRYIFGRNLSTLFATPNFGQVAPVPHPHTARIDKDGIVNDLSFNFGPPIKDRNKWTYDFEKRKKEEAK